MFDSNLRALPSLDLPQGTTSTYYDSYWVLSLRHLFNRRVLMYWGLFHHGFRIGSGRTWLLLDLDRDSLPPIRALLSQMPRSCLRPSVLFSQPRLAGLLSLRITWSKIWSMLQPVQSNGSRGVTMLAVLPFSSSYHPPTNGGPAPVGTGPLAVMHFGSS